MKRLLVNASSRLFPKRIGKIAYHKLNNPQVKKLRPHEEQMLDKAKHSSLMHNGKNVQRYQWGEGEKDVLLIHGWEGQAGNFSDLIPKLTDKGYHVHAFDAPSHGRSSSGATSYFEFIEVLGKIMDELAPKQLISHSFGGVATVSALYDRPHLSIDRYALLTTPDTFQERVDFVSDSIGLSQGVKNELIQRIERELGKNIDELKVSEYVKKINVEKALILHDENDKILPIAQSERVAEAWDSCSIEKVSGTGHFRILRTEHVLDRVVSFMFED